MSIIDTLITDRTQADVTKLKSLLSKPKVMWSNEEWSEFLLAKDKGSYNATDLNRVQEAMEYLAERFRGYGYNVPEIKRPSITEVIPGTSKLPEGYTRLEHIQSTGAEYVDTGVKLSSNSRVVMDVDLLDYATNTYGNSFFGARSASNANAFLLLCARASAETWTFMFGAKSATGTATRLGRHSIDVTGSVCLIDGVTITGTAATFTCDHNCYLFTDNKEGSANTANNSRLKLYSCKIYTNNILTRLYTPVLTASGEVGLYDSITGEFYGNAGRGVFIAGAEIESPDGNGNIPTQIIERDYWEIGGIPRKEQMDQYLSNLRTIRGLNDVMKSTPAAPSDMELLTHDEANDIEQILTDVDYLLSVMVLGWLYTAEVFCGEV